MSEGYVKYLEQRLVLAEEMLRKQGVIVAPEDENVTWVEQLPVGAVIEWYRRFPRGDMYRFVAYLQKSNEWHMVSGKSKVVKNNRELATEYLAKSMPGSRRILS